MKKVILFLILLIGLISCIKQSTGIHTGQCGNVIRYYRDITYPIDSSQISVQFSNGDVQAFMVKADSYQLNQKYCN